MVERREEKVVRKDAWWAEGGKSGVKDGGKKRGENGEKGWWEQEGLDGEKVRWAEGG
jgi:hypothetical protein